MLGYRSRAITAGARKDGIPPVDYIMAMQDYWADYFTYVEKKVTREQLFDLSIAKEKKRIDAEKPFGK
jgi:hypothetical protein